MNVVSGDLENHKKLKNEVTKKAGDASHSGVTKLHSLGQNNVYNYADMRSLSCFISACQGK